MDRARRRLSGWGLDWWRASVPDLPLLTRVPDAQPAEWLRASITTFAEGVFSILPGRFEAYARVYHPFDSGFGDPPMSWESALLTNGVQVADPGAAAAFASHGPGGVLAPTGSLPLPLLPALLDHLRPATGTPDCCYFAVWEGFGDSVVPPAVRPTLALPHRRYHVFRGPIEGARTNLGVIDFAYQSANLWWPADQRWCVATEVDFAWTYVGAARSCVQDILADPRIEAVEVTSASRW
jgi:hypothetical protein